MQYQSLSIVPLLLFSLLSDGSASNSFPPIFPWVLGAILPCLGVNPIKKKSVSWSLPKMTWNKLIQISRGEKPFSIFVRNYYRIVFLDIRIFREEKEIIFLSFENAEGKETNENIRGQKEMCFSRTTFERFCHPPYKDILWIIRSRWCRGIPRRCTKTFDQCLYIGECSDREIQQDT